MMSYWYKNMLINTDICLQPIYTNSVNFLYSPCFKTRMYILFHWLTHTHTDLQPPHTPSASLNAFPATGSSKNPIWFFSCWPKTQLPLQAARSVEISVKLENVHLCVEAKAGRKRGTMKYEWLLWGYWNYRPVGSHIAV